MLLDPPAFAHGRLARDTQAPEGTWVHAVVKSQRRFGIPDLELANVVSDMARPAIQRRLVRYRWSVVEPAVARGLGHSRCEGPLPWCWIAIQLSGSHITAQQFEAWWRWRILGLPPQEMSAACPLCGSLCAPTAKHLTSVCSASGALMDDGTPFPKHELFGRPTCADCFMARLVVVGRILAANS